MENYFTHKRFDNYAYDSVPLDQDIYLINASHEEAYHEMMLKFFDGEEYDYKMFSVAFAAARTINKDKIELSWYPNVYDRFHEVQVSLPKSAFSRCVGAWDCDKKPRIFVKKEWLDSLYLKTYSVFAMVDAANFKNSLNKNKITRKNLISLRDQIDDLSNRYSDVLFISFADSILLKSNWNPGYFKEGKKYQYNPELFIKLAIEINLIYQKSIGVDTYMVLAQGSNEYYNDPLHHVSKSGNHISLNSLGLPFAVLEEIETQARKSIRRKDHERSQIYMDQLFFNSLRFRFTFDKNNIGKQSYTTKMFLKTGRYYYCDRNLILNNLEK